MTVEEFLKVFSPNINMNISVVGKNVGVVGAYGYKHQVIKELMHYGVSNFKLYEIYSISQGTSYDLGETDEDEDEEVKYIDVFAKEN